MELHLQSKESEDGAGDHADTLGLDVQGRCGTSELARCRWESTSTSGECDRGETRRDRVRRDRCGLGLDGSRRRCRGVESDGLSRVGTRRVRRLGSETDLGNGVGRATVRDGGVRDIGGYFDSRCRGGRSLGSSRRSRALGRRSDGRLRRWGGLRGGERDASALVNDSRVLRHLRRANADEEGECLLDFGVSSVSLDTVDDVVGEIRNLAVAGRVSVVLALSLKLEPGVQTLGQALGRSVTTWRRSDSWGLRLSGSRRNSGVVRSGYGWGRGRGRLNGSTLDGAGLGRRSRFGWGRRRLSRSRRRRSLDGGARGRSGGLASRLAVSAALTAGSRLSRRRSRLGWSRGRLSRSR